MRAVGRAAGTAAVVLALDQVTKALVRAHVDRGSEDSIFPGVSLVHTRNSGVAFGLFEDGGALIAIFTALALIVLLTFFALNRGRPWAWLPTGLLVGGAIGNIVDRVRGEGVVDFIKFPAWPAFNIADIAITFGVVSLVFVLEQKPKTKADASPA
jgi:signal peptidase II